MSQPVTKSQLRQIIREELDKKINENIFQDAITFIQNNPESLAFFAPMLGIVGATAKGTIDKLKQFKNQGVKGSKMELVKKAIQASAGEGAGAIEKATGANTKGQGIGGMG
jgi:hypothetical protein